MILVTGATGNVGSRVVRELRGRDVSVRAFVRSPDKAAEKLGDDVELAVGDFSDSESLRRAMMGVTAVFVTSADGPQKVEHETAVIDAASAADASSIVKLSTIGAAAGATLPPFDWHGRIEQHLRRTAVTSVILRANFYMSNLLMAAEQVRSHGRLFAPAGGARISMIDPRDVAAAAATVLVTDRHKGQTYELTGPEAITYERIAEELSSATGRQVVFVDVPDEAARQALLEAGMPEWLVKHLTGLFPVIRQGALAQTTNTVLGLTGREPRTFAQFASAHARLFGN